MRARSPRSYAATAEKISRGGPWPARPSKITVAIILAYLEPFALRWRYWASALCRAGQRQCAPRAMKAHVFSTARQSRAMATQWRPARSSYASKQPKPSNSERAIFLARRSARTAQRTSGTVKTIDTTSDQSHPTSTASGCRVTDAGSGRTSLHAGSVFEAVLLTDAVISTHPRLLIRKRLFRDVATSRATQQSVALSEVTFSEARRRLILSRPRQRLPNRPVDEPVVELDLIGSGRT